MPEYAVSDFHREISPKQNDVPSMHFNIGQIAQVRRPPKVLLAIARAQTEAKATSDTATTSESSGMPTWRRVTTNHPIPVAMHILTVMAMKGQNTRPAP